MKNPILCNQWKEKLSMTHFRDLSPAENAALTAHLISCAECRAVRTMYHETDALIRSLPPIEPLPGLPPQLLQIWKEEGQQRTLPNFTADAHTEPIPLRTLARLKHQKARQSIHSAKKVAPSRRTPLLQPSKKGPVIVIIASIIIALLELFYAAVPLSLDPNQPEQPPPLIRPSHPTPDSRPTLLPTETSIHKENRANNLLPTSWADKTRKS